LFVLEKQIICMVSQKDICVC